MSTRISAVLSCAVLVCTLLTGCGSSPAPTTIAETDLPYGATIAFNKDSLIASQYDSRFITEGMRDAVLKYYHAIETKDESAYVAVQLPMWHDYVTGTLYGGQYTDLQLMKTAYDTCAKNFGGSYEYAMIEIASAQKCEKGSEGQQIVDMLDQLAEDRKEEKPSKHIDAVWSISVTPYLAKKGAGIRGETADTLSSEQLYLMDYNSQWYIIIT